MFLRICAIGFSAFLAYDVVRFPLIPRLAYALGAGPQAIGIAVAASTVTGIFGKWFSGALSDHWGRRRLLLIGCALCAGLPLLYFRVHDYHTLILVRLLHGTVTAILGPVTRAVVSDIATPQERGAKLGTFAAMVQIGMSAGRWLGGLLLFWGGFRFPLLAATAAGGLALWLIVTWPPGEETSSRLPIAPLAFQSAIAGLRRIMRSRLLVAAGAVEATQFLVRGAIEAFLPIYAVEVAHLNDSHVGMLFGIQMLTLVVAKPITGWWSDRLGRVPLICVGLCCSGALVWLIPRTVSLIVLSALLIGYSLGAAAATTSNLALVTDLSESVHADAGNARYGASHGFFGTLVDIGHASGPILGGLLIAHVRYQATFLILSVTLLAVTAAFALLSRWARPA